MGCRRLGVTLQSSECLSVECSGCSVAFIMQKQKKQSRPQNKRKKASKAKGTRQKRKAGETKGTRQKRKIITQNKWKTKSKKYKQIEKLRKQAAKSRGLGEFRTGRGITKNK